MRRYACLTLLLISAMFQDSAAYAEGRYIGEFLVCGPFPNSDQRARLSTDYLDGEARVAPRVGLVSASRKWGKHSTEGQSLNFLDPSLNFAQREDAVAYAHVFVKCNNERRALLLIGSDDGAAVWVNGVMAHFNDTLRSLRLDEDSVPVKLADGWNRILFKVANGGVDWALSARFKNDDDLVIQADNPAADGRFETPRTSAELLVRNVEVPPYMTISQDGHPHQVVKASIFKIGAEPAKEVRLLISSPARMVLAEKKIAEISGGQSDVSFNIPLRSMLRLPPKGVPITLNAKHGERTVGAPVVLPTGRRLLERVFSLYYLAGWEVSGKARGDSRETVFSLNFEVPPEFAGLGISVEIDVGRSVGRILVNESVKRSGFSGNSGEIRLTDRAREGEKFSIRAKVISSLRTESPRLVSSFLRASSSPVETYLKNAPLAASLFGAQIDDEKIVAEMMESLLSSDAARLRKSVAAAKAAIDGAAVKAKSYTVYLAGNAHIDLAWRWRYPETIQVCRDTFKAAIKNMETFPTFTFSQSQAQAYLWIEENDPELFKEIRKHVEEGNWEVVGGAWSEADGNMPSGEGLVRNYLYGKRYFKEKFGVDVRIGWMPDTFGHNWNMPQILKKSGIDYYVFCRAGKGQRIFWWEGLDGTRCLAYQPPAWYNSRVDKTIADNALEMDRRYGVKDVMRLYGVGDHGGGPTLHDIKQAQDLNSLKAFPNVKLSAAREFFAKISAAEKSDAKKTTFPIINDELNFTFRGCYTSQARQKRNNRRSENLLGTAETFAVLAMPFGFKYPQSELVTAWRNVGFNHFHDLLAGSGVGSIYRDAQKIYDETFQTGEKTLAEALKIIASKIDTRSKDGDAGAVPIVVFNRLGWEVTDVVEVEVNLNQERPKAVIVDDQLRTTPTQVIRAEGGSKARIVFLAKNVPSVGYRCYWMRMMPRAEDDSSAASGVGVSPTVLENQKLRIGIDPRSGCIISIFDKEHSRELISKGGKGNLLRILGDRGNAWVINYTGASQELDTGAKVEVVESGPVRGRVRVSYDYNDSSLTQDIMLADGLPQLDVAAKIDWREHNRLIKIAFPLDVRRGVATFEIPFGAIARPADGQEYPMQKWFDLTDHAPTESAKSEGKSFSIPVSLAPYFNMDSFSTEANPGDGDFDRGGRCFPDSILPPEREVEIEGIRFSLPAMRDGAKNSISCSAQEIDVKPVRVTAIAVLGAASNGHKSGRIRLCFSDGSLEYVRLSLSDWCQPAQFGEKAAFKSPNRHDRGGKTGPSCAIWLQRISLASRARRKLVALRLPAQPDLKIFALSVGNFSTPLRQTGEPVYGVTILNDCKYGCDVNRNVMSLTALRSPTDPDRNADQGMHRFSYAIYPHEGDWRDGESVKRGYEFNNRLIAIAAQQHGGQLPPTHSFIKIEQNNVILTACKRAEDGNEMVLRFYEAHGKPTRAKIEFDSPIKKVSEIDLIEWNERRLDVQDSLQRLGKQIEIALRPHEIKTIRLSLTK